MNKIFIFIFIALFAGSAFAGKGGKEKPKKQKNPETQERRAARRQTNGPKGKKTASFQTEAVDASPDDLAIYDEIISLIESKIETSEDKDHSARDGRDAIYALRRFHRLNKTISAEIDSTGYSSTYNKSDGKEPLIQAGSKRPSLHGLDHSQMKNSLKAINMFIILSDAYHFAKENGNEMMASFLETLGRGNGCLPARIAAVDQWYDDEKKKINLKSTKIFNGTAEQLVKTHFNSLSKRDNQKDLYDNIMTIEDENYFQLEVELYFDLLTKENTLPAGSAPLTLEIVEDQLRLFALKPRHSSGACSASGEEDSAFKKIQKQVNNFNDVNSHLKEP